MFVRTADENYIAARWCCMQRLHTDFFWLGTHALEKYMKAVLLYNGRSVKRYGHDVTRLYRSVHTIAKRLLPTTLNQPATLVGIHWVDRTATQFIEHLALNGNPDNRYLTYGYSTRSQDLHMLDAMVYAVRRLICSLDEPLQLFGRSKKLPSPPSHRQILEQQPEYRATLSMPLDDLIRDEAAGSLRFAALNLKLAFAPETFAHDPMPSGSASRTPVLVRRIMDPLRSKNKAVLQDGIATANWLLKNTQVSGNGKQRTGVAAEIADAVRDAEMTLASLAAVH